MNTLVKTPVNRKQKNQGMNWISQYRRLAIYARDGFACCYCFSSVEEGIQLTLDHLTPYSKGGSHHEKNLVTCCRRCNSARGNRDLQTFAYAAASYKEIEAKTILAHVNSCTDRALDIKTAKELIARRGSCRQVLLEMI
ncbi:HNH endonuclease [Runella slithyformis]|uniref:HNH endonuclease n=1 Tax=Runella slithyformis (strain ATCC 29530 / DSM 19594 / LMG 11500 / NCIMB 11436 / LSU 4) TaxID=761193 RepID=A0A7U3ZRS4_RUNSL|nr:HNH endonuclease [Runella slithyformis]AEI52175.1 HNH endonuclease [Runella slithyformis DSM 19594]